MRSLARSVLPGQTISLVRRLARSRRSATGRVESVPAKAATETHVAAQECYEAPRHLNRAHLSALIVLDDAELERLVSAAAWGSFLHQGQIYMTTRPHLVQERIVRRPRCPWASLQPSRSRSARHRQWPTRQHTLAGDCQRRFGGTLGCGRHLRRAFLPSDRTYRRHASDASMDPGGFQSRCVRHTLLLSGGSHLVRRRKLLRSGAGDHHRNSLKCLELADRVHSGIVHINDQTVNDEVVAPFNGVRGSGTGARLV